MEERTASAQAAGQVVPHRRATRRGGGDAASRAGQDRWQVTDDVDPGLVAAHVPGGVVVSVRVPEDDLHAWGRIVDLVGYRSLSHFVRDACRLRAQYWATQFDRTADLARRLEAERRAEHLQTEARRAQEAERRWVEVLVAALQAGDVDMIREVAAGAREHASGIREPYASRLSRLADVAEAML